MSILECATAALGFNDLPVYTPVGYVSLRVLFLAIGGHESNWCTRALGDSGLDLQYGYCSGENCDGVFVHEATSWGWLQVHNVHAALLTRLSGSSDPCAWAAWLYDPAHTVTAAIQLVGLTPTLDRITGPYGPWYADRIGGPAPWTDNLAAAKAAMAAVTQTYQQQTGSPPPSSALVPGVVSFLFGAGTVAVGTTAAILAERRHRARTMVRHRL
jgi:hypothetical protein